MVQSSVSFLLDSVSANLKNAEKKFMAYRFKPNLRRGGNIATTGGTSAAAPAHDAFAKLMNLRCRDVKTYSKVVHACQKSGDVDTARRCYDAMVRERVMPNTITFCSLIATHGKGGDWKGAIGWLDTMRTQSVIPDNQTFNAALTSCRNSTDPVANSPTTTNFILGKMAQCRVSKNVVTYNVLVSIASKSGDWIAAEKYLQTMRKERLEPELTTLNTVLLTYTRAKQIEKAERFLKTFQNRADQVSYGTMVDFYSQRGNVDAAIRYLRAMEKSCTDTVDRIVVYNQVMMACGRVGNEILANSLMDELLRKNLQPTVVTYTALIQSVASSGEAEAAEKWFKTLREAGLQPDVHIFGGLVHAHTRAGQPEQAHAWLRKMHDEFGVKPDTACYNCVIAAYAQIRSPECFAVLESMAVLPNLVCFTSAFQYFSIQDIPEYESIL